MANIAEGWLLARITKDVLVEFFILLFFVFIYCILHIIFYIITLPFRIVRWVLNRIYGFFYRNFYAKFYNNFKIVKNVYLKRKDYPDAYRLGWQEIKMLLLIDYEITKNRLYLIFFVNTFGANLLWLYRKTLQKFLLFFVLPDKFYGYDIINEWEAIKVHVTNYLVSLRNWYIGSLIFGYCIILGGRVTRYFPQLFWDVPSKSNKNWPFKNPLYLIDYIEIFDYSNPVGRLWYIPNVSLYSLWTDKVWGIIGYLRARTLFDWFAEYIPYMTQMYFTTPREIKAHPTRPVDPDWYHDEFWTAADMHIGRSWRYYWLTRGQQETYERFVDYVMQKLRLPLEFKEYFYVFIEWYDGFVWNLYELPLNLVVPYLVPHLNDVDFLAFCYLDVYRPIRYYIGFIFFLWYLLVDFTALVVEMTLLFSFYFFCTIVGCYYLFSWIYIICIILTEIFFTLLKNISIFIISLGVLIGYGRQAWYNVYVRLTKFRLAYKKRMLQVYWYTWYHPTVLGLRYYLDTTLFNNRNVELVDYKVFQLTIDKFLYRLLVEDQDEDELVDEDDFDEWFEEERLFKHVIFATTGGYNNVMLYLVFPIIIAYPYISTFMAKIFGWLFYFERFAETEFERARESITFTVSADFWAQDELLVLQKISVQYFLYKHHFKYITWYFDYLKWDYFDNKQYEIYTNIIELVDELVWECGMPCIIAFFVCLILYHYIEEFGAYFYIEDLFDFMMVYFCVLADESLDLSVFWNNISTLMLDTQCNVDYIGFYGLKPNKEFRNSTFWFRDRMIKTLRKEYYGKRRLKRFIAYWQPRWFNGNMLPVRGRVTRYDRYWYRQSKYELEKRRNRPNDPIWEDNNYEYLQNLRVLNRKKYLESKNKDKNK